MAGSLYLVATPIGHLGDVSERMRDVLASVALIAAEDTRRTGRLLKHLDISGNMTSYHDHNERQKWQLLIETLERDDDVAVVTDAGTPGIADPGWRVVQEAIARDIQIVAIPGPTALVPALILSGLPVHRFVFEGYLPKKSGGRLRRLEELRQEERTMIFYETPHRVAKIIGEMHDVLGDRQASFSRELTKQHEETVRGPLSELRARLEEKPPKGEFVIVVTGTGHEPTPSGGNHSSESA